MKLRIEIEAKTKDKMREAILTTLYRIEKEQIISSSERVVGEKGEYINDEYSMNYEVKK